MWYQSQGVAECLPITFEKEFLRYRAQVLISALTGDAAYPLGFSQRLTCHEFGKNLYYHLTLT